MNKLNAMEVGSSAAEQRLRQVRDDILAAQQAKASTFMEGLISFHDYHNKLHPAGSCSQLDTDPGTHSFQGNG